MRTIVDIPDNQIKMIDQLSKKNKVSRAEMIRRALTTLINSNLESNNNYQKAFGSWKQDKIDGVVYQQKIRDEWK